jgi:hypothetical protein
MFSLLLLSPGIQSSHCIWADDCFQFGQQDIRQAGDLPHAQLPHVYECIMYIHVHSSVFHLHHPGTVIHK